MAPISGKFQIVLKLVPADALGNFRDRWVRMPFIMNCHKKIEKATEEHLTKYILRYENMIIMGDKK